MTKTTTTKLSLKEGAFLSDGERLVEVMQVFESSVLVEDAQTNVESRLTHYQIATGNWHQIEKADLPPPRVADRELQRLIDESWCG